MLWFFSWYVAISILGGLTFPLAYRLLPSFADRGYAFSRAIGLLVWGYVFWLFTSLGLSQNDAGGLLLALLVLAAISWWALKGQWGELIAWIKEHAGMIRSVEILFFLAFAFMAFVRASNPELTSAEKPMELMFINAILRSPTFPPRDAWLSGYAISYYYLGYVMTAMLAKLTGVPGSAAHNLMTALIFGLSAVGAYGILYNLLAARRKSSGTEASTPNRRLALLAPLFLLLVSNVEGFLEILHRRGLFWRVGPDGELTSTFWTWLDIKDLNLPPLQPFQWIPERYLWWWRASRVVQDFDLPGTFREIIDEFPFFSFLHADLHPHVLAIPFGLLAVGIALHIFLGGWRDETALFGYSLRLDKPGFFLTALTLGGLAFLNTWDILIAAALIVGAYVLTRVSEAGWGWERLEEALIFGLPLGLLSFLLYLPFYVSFSSQLGGVLPNLVYPTRGAYLWVMFGILFVPMFVYLFYLWRVKNLAANWRASIILSSGFVLLLWGSSWVTGWITSLVKPDVGMFFLDVQRVPGFASLFAEATQKRLAYIGGLLTLLMVLVPALALLLTQGRRRDTVKVQLPPKGIPYRATVFVLLLIVLAALLVIGPEFFYLRDQFGTRINTIFKFYYQAWMLWSLAASYGIAVLLQNLHRGWNTALRAGLLVLLVLGLTYPVFGLGNRTGNFRLDWAFEFLKTTLTSEDAGAEQDARDELASLWTLDYFQRVEEQTPDEAAAIRWLQKAPDGVVAEAIGGSYSGYARISAYTGLPTVLGWPGHESQWRGGYDEQGSRENDIRTLFATGDWQVAREIIDRYQIRYVYIGHLERVEPLQEEKFSQFLPAVFQQGNVTIYEAP